MPLSSIARDAVKKPSIRPVAETAVFRPGGQSSIGSVAARVTKEYHEQKGIEITNSEINMEVDWKNCRHALQYGEKHNCRKFFSLCSKEKCPTKYFEPKEG